MLLTDFTKENMTTNLNLQKLSSTRKHDICTREQTDNIQSGELKNRLITPQRAHTHTQKDNVSPIHVMKVWGGGIPPLIPNLGTRWTLAVNITARLLYPWKERKYPFSRRLGGPDSQSGYFEKYIKRKEVSCLPLQGFDPCTVQAIAQDRTLITLSWLPGDKIYIYIYIYMYL
jgi:hypothetical protein